MAAPPDDETAALYRLAGLRTPAECAARDLEGGYLWLKHLTNRLCCEYPSGVVWLATTTTTPATTTTASWAAPPAQQRDVLKVVDAASDPFGWDNGCAGEEESSVANVGNLDSVVERIRDEVSGVLAAAADGEGAANTPAAPVPLVIQSLTPILQIHGLARTLRFLKSVSSLCCPVVVPALTELLTPSQHRQLEDTANALLCLHGGEAVLLREGVRERGNVVRENLPFRIVPDADRPGERMVEITAEKEDVTERGGETVDSLVGKGDEGVASSQSASSRRKVRLKLEDEEVVGRGEGGSRRTGENEASSTAAAATASPAPRIYLQDDDPEFEDYDEEDPDDDLDI